MPKRSPTAVLFDSARAERVRERTRLSKAIHDELGQALTAAGLELELLKLDHPSIAEPIATAQRKLETAFAHARQLSDEVQPDPATKFGLLGAFERLANRFRKRYQGQFNVHLTDDGYPEGPLATAMYEICESVLENVLEHSYAGTVSFGTTAKPRVFTVQIEDDGVGFETKETARGYGLTLLQRMSREHKIKLTIQGSVRHGTLVRLDGERELQNKKNKEVEGNATQHGDRRVAGR